MSKSKSKDGEAKPKGKKLMLIVGALVLLLAGAGGAYAAVATGLIGHGAAEKAKPEGPQLVLKGEEDPYAPAPKAGEGEEAHAPVYGDGGSKYRRSYYNFSEGFTSNLKDSSTLVQINLAASTLRDGRVLQWLKLHELAIRSAILIELANTPEEDVYSVEGKKRLEKRLVAAINKVLIQNEGFGGVDAVHFETFLVQ